MHTIRGQRYDDVEWSQLDPMEREWEDYEPMRTRQWLGFIGAMLGVVAFWVVVYLVSF